MKFFTVALISLKKLVTTVAAIFSKKNQHCNYEEDAHIDCMPGVAEAPERYFNTTVTAIRKNHISDGAEQCDASFLFIPPTLNAHLAEVSKGINHNNKNSFMKTFVPKPV